MSAVTRSRSGREKVLLRAAARLLVAMLAAGLIAGAVGVALSARGGAATATRAAGACRDWVSSRNYREQIRAVRPLVPKMKRAFAAPGLSVAIGADGELVWSQSCGFADLRALRPVTRATQFRVGSVSKPLTAAVVARLDQQGQLDVDANIRKYVAEFPRTAPAPTLRQLGGHLGGIRHYEGGEAINTRHYRSVTDALRVFINDPLVAAPGAEFYYSSYGFNLLGASVEATTQQTFAAAVHSTLLQPLRLTNTSVGGELGHAARFYEVTRRRRAVPAPRIDLSDRFPAGGFLSTAEDLVRFGIGITDSGFLNADAQRLLFTSQRTRAGKQTGYAFGFEIGESPVGPIAGHTGNVVGGTALLLVHPRTRVVVAITTNVGFVTAPTPPALTGTPEPPQLAMPFIRRVLETRD